MTTILQRGATWLRDKLPQVGREYVEYRRGTAAIESLEVVQGRSLVESFTVEDSEGSYKSIDWLIDLWDLNFGDSQIEPQKGDRIIRVNESGIHETYEVLPITGGREFEVVDERLQRSGKGPLARVHTKQITVAGQ